MKLKNQKYYNLFLLFALIFFSSIYYVNFIKADLSLINKLRGKILLQVEENGEAWYVSPITDLRYSLGRPSDAYLVMKELGIGISNEDIKKIPIGVINDKEVSGPDTDNDGLEDGIEDSLETNKNNADTDNDGYSDYTEIINGYNPNGEGKISINQDYAKQQAGKILLQVEKNGEAWYVNPDDNKRYYLGRPINAFQAMRSLSLGITNDNLNKIPEFSYREDLTNDYIVENHTRIMPDDPDSIRYTDSSNKYSIAYPKHWKIQKSSSRENVIYLGDYYESPITEKKAVVYITYVKESNNIALNNFSISQKPDAEKNINETLEINGYKAIKEGFKYDKLNSHEITTTIQKNPQEYVIITMMAYNTGTYNADYTKLIYSIGFGK